MGFEVLICFDVSKGTNLNQPKYIKLEDVPRSTPGYWKVLDTIRAKMKLAIMKLNNKIIESMVCIQKLSKELFRS